MNVPSREKRQNWPSASFGLRGRGIPSSILNKSGERIKEMAKRFHWPDESQISDTVSVSSCLMRGPVRISRVDVVPIQLSNQKFMDLPSRIKQPLPLSQIVLDEHKLFHIVDLRYLGALLGGYLALSKQAQWL